VEFTVDVVEEERGWLLTEKEELFTSDAEVLTVGRKLTAAGRGLVIGMELVGWEVGWA
jgi:hypothetical protein